jgi:hypothetical protein
MTAKLNITIIQNSKEISTLCWQSKTLIQLKGNQYSKLCVLLT